MLVFNEFKISPFSTHSFGAQNDFCPKMSFDGSNWKNESMDLEKKTQVEDFNALDLELLGSL